MLLVRIFVTCGLGYGVCSRKKDGVSVIPEGWDF